MVEPDTCSGGEMQVQCSRHCPFLVSFCLIDLLSPALLERVLMGRFVHEFLVLV